jgi:hypothetical protein
MLYTYSATVRCEIGKKVIAAGGNAVLGYSQNWDTIEGASGIVARGYGTACRILKVSSPSSSLSSIESIITYTDVDQMVIGSFNISEDVDINTSDDNEVNLTAFTTDSLKLLKFDKDMNIRANIPLVSFGPVSDKMFSSTSVRERYY